MGTNSTHRKDNRVLRLRAPIVVLLIVACCCKKSSAFLQWINANGGYVHPHLEICRFDGMGYGLRTIGVIRPGETMFIIPPELALISEQDNAESDLATQLCQEKLKGQESSFFPFLESLPEDTNHVPALWPQSWLEQIEGTMAAEDAAAMRAEWAAEAAAWANTATLEESRSTGGGGGGGGASSRAAAERTWLWARASVQCRAFEFSAAAGGEEEGGGGGGGRYVALLPPVSVANHHDTVHCKVRRRRRRRQGAAAAGGEGGGGGGEGGEGGEEGFEITAPARRSWYPGEQVYISYGELSFQQKLLSFGWVDRGEQTDSGSLRGTCVTAARVPLPSTGGGEGAEGSSHLPPPPDGHSGGSSGSVLVELKTPLPPPANPSFETRAAVLGALDFLAAREAEEAAAAGPATAAAVREGSPRGAGQQEEEEEEERRRRLGAALCRAVAERRGRLLTPPGGGGGGRERRLGGAANGGGGDRPQGGDDFRRIRDVEAAAADLLLRQMEDMGFGGPPPGHAEVIAAERRVRNTETASSTTSVVGVKF